LRFNVDPMNYSSNSTTASRNYSSNSTTASNHSADVDDISEEEMHFMVKGCVKSPEPVHLPYTPLAVGRVQEPHAVGPILRADKLIRPEITKGSSSAGVKLDSEERLKRMVVQSPTVCPSDCESQSIMVTTSCNAGDLEKAESCMRIFLDTPNAEHDNLLVAFRSIIRLCCHLNQPQRAVLWFQELLERDIVPSQGIFQALVCAFAEVGSSADLKMYFSGLTEYGPLGTDACWQALLKACARCRELESASELFNHILESGHSFNANTFNTIIHAYSQVGDLAKAEHYFAEMERYGLEPCTVSYNAMINTCASTADVERAEAWWKKMVQSNVMPNEVTYGALCKAFARKGDPRKVKQILMAIERHGNELNEYFFAAWISACDQANPPDVAGAEEAFWELAKRDMRPQRVRRVLSRVVGEERVKELMNLYRVKVQSTQMNSNVSGKKPKAAQSNSSWKRSKSDKNICHSSSRLPSRVKPQGAAPRHCHANPEGTLMRMQV